MSRQSRATPRSSKKIHPRLATAESAASGSLTPRSQTFNKTVDNYRPADMFNHMAEHQAQLDLVFRALGDHTRRAMLQRLAKGEHTVSELAAPYRMSLAAASKHIQTLERAGLVKRTVRGRIHYCRIDPRPLARADDWLRGYERLWDTRIERLVELLRHPDNEPSDTE
jgi:DNA-binding transcriptional ArsR family regulator